MNNEIQKDTVLSQLYRETATEEPPAYLDAAILAAAKREVHSRPQHAGMPFFKRSWHVPVSIAAMVIVTVSLFPLLKDHSTDSATTRFDFPHDTAKPQAAATAEKTINLNDEIQRREASVLNGGHMPEPPSSIGSATPEAQPNQTPDATQSLKSTIDQKVPATGSGETIATTQKPQSSGFVADPQAMPQRAKESDSATQTRQGVAASAPPAAHVEAEKFETKTFNKQQTLGTTNRAAPAAPAAASVETKRSLYKSEQRSAADAAAKESKDDLVEAKKQEITRSTPQDWIKKIEQLVQQNKWVEAKAEMVDFRKRYPYYPISPSLKQTLEISE